MAQFDSPAQIYRRANEALSADVEGEIILFSQTSWSYVELDAIGGVIWTLLKTPRSLAALVEALMGDFDVDRARCSSDAKDFLDVMIGQGLVAVV